MIRHRKIRLALYDLVRGELDPNERGLVEAHLRDCKTCREELGEIRAAVKGLPPGTDRPSLRLPESYWGGFAARIEQRLARQHPAPSPAPFLAQVRLLFLQNRRWMIAAGGATVTAGLLLFFLRPVSTPEHPPGTTGGPPSLPTADERLTQVFRRSKALLVGLDNLRPASGEPVDLSTERHVSRELVTETRALRHAPLNPRSALVVRDLERILIELANTDDRSSGPQMEMIRNGMRQENILFRIRMAEAAGGPGRRTRTGDRGVDG
jgi:anti-sigma factor RsiW